MLNKVLDHSVLPVFSSINLKHVTKIIQKILTNCYNTVHQIASQKHTIWDTLYYPLMIAENELQCVWSPVRHLNSVKHSLELRKIYEENTLYISEYRSWVNQHYGLYKTYKSFRNSNAYERLSIAQKRVLENALCNFELSGVCLSPKLKKKYMYINFRLSQLSLMYANNVFDATLGWSKLVTERQALSGIPDYKLKIAWLEAQEQGLKGWLFTLQYPSYYSVLLHCDTAELREELYWAFNTRASDQGPNAGKWDNTMIMDEILSLRYELARILGFNTYLEKSLVKKMARSPEQIFSFLTNLFNQVHQSEYKEFLEIQTFAKEKYACMTLKPWDIEYYREKQKQHVFSITDEKLRCFFPENVVLHGMFKVVHILYGIFIKERFHIETWHPDVRFFDIFDKSGEWKGGFYLDIYVRDNKCEGAWMDDLVSMMYRRDFITQKPIACLTCNFNRVNKSNVPCFLLTHNDVLTLFHEFGHVLHHVMTCIDIPEISGVNGTPWDVIELPSQFMEKFCWNPKVLRLISEHYQTKESLSKYMICNLLQTRTYHASYYLLRQIIYGLFDLRIHHEYVPGVKGQVLTIFKEITKKMLTCYPIIDWDRFPNAFLHIFSNDYAAGYYSYLWADMLASSVWFRFQKTGVLNPTTGKLFLNDILSLSGVIDLEKCLINFCGREITVESMYRYYDILVSTNHVV